MHSRTARGAFAGMILALTGLFAAAPALATVNPTSVARPFTVRYAINTNGDIAQAANTLLTCPAGAVETQSLSTCAQAQAGSPGDDNYFDMQYVDVDNDPSTFDSSSAQLNVPSGAQVLFAGLYWGAALDQGETLPLQCIPGGARTGAPAQNAAAAASAWLAPPGGGGYVPVNASVFDTYTENIGCGNPGSTDERTRYQAFADVTSLVQAGGGGTYTLANVQAGTGADRHAGWSLVVAYEDPSMPARNLTIFDGFAQVDNGNTVSIPVSGFKTPLAPAPVNTQLGIVSYEGDLDLSGDSLALNGTTLSDAAHPAANFFDSGISNLGSPVTTKNPNYVNQLGFDSDVLAVPPGVLGNGATSATIALSTAGDRYLPGVVYFRTDIYAPQMVLKKTVTDLNGGDVNPGDVLQYDISSTNTGISPAFDSRIDDAIPPNTTYQPGSLQIVSSPGGIAGAKTDPLDSDQAEYDSGGNGVHFRIGTGATAPSLGSDGGGEIAPGESFDVRFDVTVNAGTADGTQIVNTAVLSSKDENGVPYTSIASAPAAVTVRGVPDVTILKSHNGQFLRGSQGTFTLLVSNVGGTATTAPVTIDDTLPSGLGVVSATGTGWACTVDTTADSLHCSRSDPLPQGSAYPAVSVVVNVLESVPDTVVNLGVTGGGGETNTTNDSSSDTVSVASSSDVAIVKTVSPTTTAPGVNATYTLVVTNNGPSTAKGVMVSDPIPAGLKFVSVAPSACGLAGTTVTCALGDMTVGQSVTITVVAAIPSATPKSTKTNTATVTSTTPDSNLANNHDSATVAIVPPPSKLAITKTADPTHTSPGGTVVFTIVLRVPSPVDAKQVDVCDTLPGAMTFVSAPGATFSKGRACWHLDVAQAGSSTTFHITAKVDANTTASLVRNVVVATAANAAPVSAKAPVALNGRHGVKGASSKQPGVTG